ncbi:MAG: hypothetical protein RSC55_08960, partial [Oscillospiraceae bacterium]
MHRQIKNKDGSALVWAILVLAMLSIIVATVLTVALSYQRRSYINNYSQQAYFTSRSAADAISNEIVGGGTHLIPAVGKTINLGTLKFAKGKMGECTAKVVRNDEYSMTVTATTTLRGGSTSYSTRIISDNIVVPQFAGGLRVSKLNASDKFTVNGDVYVTDFDVSEINCHVTGNVFAPKGSIALMSEGNVAGSIIAYGSIKSGTPFSPKYFPLMALSTEGITGFTKSTKQYPVFDQFSRLFSYTNQFTSPFVTFPIIPTDDEMKRGSLNLVD